MFLNYWKTSYSTTLTEVDGTKAYFIDGSYNKVKTALSYPVDVIADKVRIDKLPPTKRTAFILAAGNGHFAGVQPVPLDSTLKYEYKITPLTLTQLFAHRHAENYSDSNVTYISVDNSACASSLHVLDYAHSLLKLKGYTRVIVLAVEDQVNPLTIDFFIRANALCKGLPSAFDPINQGFYLGQGAVTAVFEPLPIENTLAEVWETHTASEDNSNSLGMREDGQGYVRAISQIPEFRFSDITVVKTHGTGTAINNIAEKNALESTLKAPFKATSYKPLIGHTLGASGLLEAVLLMEEISYNKRLPPIVNRTEMDKTYLSDYSDYDGGLVLNLAAGMGNIYTASLWEPYERTHS